MAGIDYPAILEEAWAQSLAPRDNDAPTIISIFAGCGGSSLGYSMAGYRELLAVEWNDNAVETFKLNFPDVPVYHGDIHELTVKQCLNLAGMEIGELDLLDGSPPCQGFSTAGKRQIDDRRNQLYMQFVRLLRGLQPKVFVMENVSGLVKGKMKLIFADIMRELKTSGYKVRCKLLNAMYFNVPQSRQRLIFIGVREDLGAKVSFPRAQKIIVANIAMQGANTKDCGNFNLNGRITKLMNGLPAGSNIGKYYKKQSYFSYVRCPIGKPAMTLQKSVTYGHISMWHHTENRNCSRNELMRICSYPDKFQFVGKYDDAVNRMGNSVPPLFMRAIASHIRQEILAS